VTTRFKYPSSILTRRDGIIDFGLGDYREYLDVNGDGLPDYCRFVGDSPDIFLSCQLGTKNGGLSFQPYGFNSSKGIDPGYPSLPQALVDVNHDGRPDFCRYVGDWSNPDLSCVLAETGGFSADQYTNPDSFLVSPLHLHLEIAADGTPFEYITNPAQGSWFASATNANGMRARFEGDATTRSASNSIGPIYYSNGTRIRILSDGGGPISQADSTLGRGLLLNISVIWSAEGNFELVVKGTGGIWKAKTGYPYFKGFDYQRSVDTTTGNTYIHVTTWDCAGSNPGALCTNYYGGNQAAGSQVPVWIGPAPPSLDQFIPDQISLLEQFRAVTDLMVFQADNAMRTGIPWFDSKHWYEHTSSDWGVIQSSLTQDAKDRISRVQALADLAKAGSAIIGAGFGGGVPGAALGGLLGNVFFGWVSRTTVDAINERDANFCASVDYHWEGCEEYAKHEQRK